MFLPAPPRWRRLAAFRHRAAIQDNGAPPPSPERTSMTLPARLLALALLGFTAIGTSAAATQAMRQEVAPSVRIVRAEFGLMNPPEAASPGFQPSPVVPHVPDQGYGWVIVVESTKPTVRVQEEFTLPRAPATWGSPEPDTQRALSKDGRTLTTIREVEPQDGVVSQAWAIAPGDPKGRYRIRVRIEDGPATTFSFDVK